MATCFSLHFQCMFAAPLMTSSHTWGSLLDQNTTATFAVASNANPHVVDPRHATLSPAGRLVWDPERPAWRRGLMSRARATLMGRIHSLPVLAADDAHTRCFLAHHPDAASWAPGAPESPHWAVWARFVPTHIHWVGGFGDEHYIGPVSVDAYRSAAQAALTEAPPGTYTLMTH